VRAGAAGLFWRPGPLAGRSGSVRLLVGTGAVVLAVWSVWATFGLTLVYQRLSSSLQPEALRAGFIGFQLDVADKVGFGRPVEIQRGPEQPEVVEGDDETTDGSLGALYVVGDCDALYMFTGNFWQPVEQPLYDQRWKVTFAPQPRGAVEPLWSAGPDGAPPEQVIWARWVDDDRVRLDLESTTDGARVPGKRDLVVVPGDEYLLDVQLDPAADYLEVSHDGRILLGALPPSFEHAEPSRLGAQPDPDLGPTRFDGMIEKLSTAPICERIVDEYLEGK
jgi:hypothetical protein